MKIYIPKNNEIRNRVVREISGTEEFNYTCNKNEYKFFRELSEEEFNSLSIHSKEHESGNVLFFKNGEIYILDGLGYFRVKFESVNEKE